MCSLQKHWQSPVFQSKTSPVHCQNSDGSRRSELPTPPTSFQIFRKTHTHWGFFFPRHQNTAKRRAPSAICLGGDIYRLFPLKRDHLFLFRRQSVPWASTRERTQGEEENVLIPWGLVRREAAMNFRDDPFGDAFKESCVLRQICCSRLLHWWKNKNQSMHFSISSDKNCTLDKCLDLY